MANALLQQMMPGYLWDYVRSRDIRRLAVANGYGLNPKDNQSPEGVATGQSTNSNPYAVEQEVFDKATAPFPGTSSTTNINITAPQPTNAPQSPDNTQTDTATKQTVAAPGVSTNQSAFQRWIGPAIVGASLTAGAAGLAKGLLPSQPPTPPEGAAKIRVFYGNQEISPGTAVDTRVEDNGTVSSSTGN